MTDKPETKDNLEEILRKKRDEETETEKREAEKHREAYLRRTGRTEMKP
jgi:uncharacterized protein YnzC (UPF0291/DUF896 family)